MRKTPRIILFIFLNIIISAGVTLSVLWVWEQLHPQPKLNQANLNSETPKTAQSTAWNLDQISPIELSSSITNEDISIQIRTIVGAGDLSVEFSEIINRGENPADLTSWQLLDEDGNVFAFPALILNSNGAIKVFSKDGVDSVIELFWQSDKPIWQSGETARLLNAAGELINSYTIP